MIHNRTKNQIVLVGVLKSQRDFDILLRQHWYRIPVAHAPVQQFQYLAFYQPAGFVRNGKCIRYYARVLGYRTVRRDRLLPDESDHPRARDLYLRIRVGKIQKLARPIRNVIPRRVNFGFTTLHRLRTARDLLQLYDIAPIEQIVEDALRRMKIPVKVQYTIRCGRKHFRLDCAVFCKHGAIAIECDNTASHRTREQKKKDKQKDRTLRVFGWTVLRLSEKEILLNLPHALCRIGNTIVSLGGA